MITGNEPANPISESEKDRLDQYPHISYPGLSIRQQFAMAAMTGMIMADATLSSQSMSQMYPESDIAKRSVDYADALINELNRTEADNGTNGN